MSYADYAVLIAENVQDYEQFILKVNEKEGPILISRKTSSIQRITNNQQIQ